MPLLLDNDDLDDADVLLPLSYDGVHFAPSRRRRRRVRFALEENQVREYQLSIEEKEGKRLAFQRICANRHVAQLEYHQEQRQEAQQRARLNDDNNNDNDRFQPPRRTAPWNLQTVVLFGLVMMLPMLMHLHAPLCCPMSPTPTAVLANVGGDSFFQPMPMPMPTKTALFLPAVGASSWTCGSNNTTSSGALELVVLPCRHYIDISSTDVLLRGPTDLVLSSLARPSHHSGNQVLPLGNTATSVWVGDHQAVTITWCFVLQLAALLLLLMTSATCFRQVPRHQVTTTTTTTTVPVLCCRRHSQGLERPWGRFEKRRIWMLIRTRTAVGNWTTRRVIREVWMRPSRHPIQTLSTRRIRPRLQMVLRRPTIENAQPPTADAPIHHPILPTNFLHAGAPTLLPPPPPPPPPSRILFLTHHDAAGCRDSLHHGGDSRALLLVPSFSREIISDLHRRLLLDPLHFLGCVKFYRTHQGLVVVVSVVMVVPEGCWCMQCVSYFDFQGLDVVVSVSLVVEVPAGYWHRQCIFEFVVVPILVFLDRPLLHTVRADVQMPPPPHQFLSLTHYNTPAYGDYLEHGGGGPALPLLLLLAPSASRGIIWDLPRRHVAPLQFLLHAAGAGVPMLLPPHQHQHQHRQGIYFLTHLNASCGGAYSGNGGEHDDLFRQDAADERVFQEPEAIADCEDWSHGFHRLFRQTRKRWRTVDAAVDWTDAFYLVFDVPVLRRSLRLASKPRVDYAGMC